MSGPGEYALYPPYPKDAADLSASIAYADQFPDLPIRIYGNVRVQVGPEWVGRTLETYAPIDPRPSHKFGDQSLKSKNEWAVILMEEVGEVARAILECETAQYRKELIEVAAVAVAAVEALDAQEGN